MNPLALGYSESLNPLAFGYSESLNPLALAYSESSVNPQISEIQHLTVNYFESL